MTSTSALSPALLMLGTDKQWWLIGISLVLTGSVERKKDSKLLTCR